MIKVKENYEALVPDTLDLAERAKLAINALMGLNKKSENYQPCGWTEFYRNPPVISNMTHCGGNLVNIGNNTMWGKYLEALIQMRVASGYLGEQEVDRRSIDGVLSHLEDDGLLLYHFYEADEGKKETTSRNQEGRLMTAMTAMYKLTEDERYTDALRCMAKGCRSQVVYKDDYAFFPDANGNEPLGGSTFETNDFWNSSTDVIYRLGMIVQALSRWYLISRDEESLDLAGRLVRFMLKERFWKPECDPEAVVSAEHGHFEGHIHAELRGFLGILDYALVVNDETLKLFVRDAYEYIRTFGIARIGLFGEICGVADMTCLAVKLSDAGVGDYWEDVDQYVRNHLTESQVLDAGPARELAKHAPELAVMPWEEDKDFFDRIIGTMNNDATNPTMQTLGYNLCCTYNGFAAFYHAWEGIVRFDSGTAQINLLLNRASEWLDIDAYEPYEGRVVIHNKKAERLSVRIPRFADLKEVTATVNGKPVNVYYTGRYLQLSGMSAGDTIKICYPLPESKAEYTLGWTGIHIPGWTEQTKPYVHADPKPYVVYASSQLKGCECLVYACSFKGNTLVDISPRDNERPGYPLYKRDHLKRDTAPMVNVERNIPERLIDWRI